MSITNRLFQIEPLGWTGRGLKIVHLIIKVIMHTGTAQTEMHTPDKGLTEQPLVCLLLNNLKIINVK